MLPALSTEKKTAAKPCWRLKLAKGVATIAERKRVAEVLTVLKHALFKAITINAGGDDPDEGNKVRWLVTPTRCRGDGGTKRWMDCTT